MTLLVINASIRGDESNSRELSFKLADRFTDECVIERDLSEGMRFVCHESFQAAGQEPTERDVSGEAAKTVQLADELIEELMQADTIIFGAPVYNFCVPGSLKAWADLVARAGTTFKYTDSGPKGLLENKKAYIIATSGGTPICGDMDFMSPWLKHFLGFLGIEVADMVTADGIMGDDGDEKIEAAHRRVQTMSL